MQCGCECTSCDIIDSATGHPLEPNIEDPARCNAQFSDFNSGLEISCNTRNESNCEAEFSNSEQLPWCAIREPSRWAPLYDLSNALDLSAFEGNDTADADSSSSSGQGGLGGAEDTSSEDAPVLDAEPIVTSTEYMYTSQSAFGKAAMERIVREPQLDLLATDATIAADLQVMLLLLQLLLLFLSPL